MSIVFNAADHSYKSIEVDDIKWISVTSLVSNFKKPFDAKAVAAKVTNSKRSKWYGIAPEKILEIWDNEANRATTLGTYYHNQREYDLCSLASLEREGITIPIIPPVAEIEGLKQAPVQRLDPGVYPEHMVFLKSAGICGQADRVEVVQDVIDIYDYKTNKEIKTQSFTNWEGVSEKMLHPIDHLDDCNFIHYAIQLSIYLYIMIKHNPNLKPGKIILEHIIFKKSGVDKYGNPVYEKDSDGNPIVDKVVPYELPYLKKEVTNIIKYLQANPEFKNKKK